MCPEPSHKDILAWASARRKERFDPVTGEFTPVRFTSPEHERDEWRYAVLEQDAMITEYNLRISELVPGTASALEKRQVYWDRIVELERFKKELSERIEELNTIIANQSTSAIR